MKSIRFGQPSLKYKCLFFMGVILLILLLQLSYTQQ